MKKSFYKLTILFGLVLLLSSFYAGEKPINSKMDSDYCRMTCTTYVADGFGGIIGISASAGGIFTDCQTALTNACKKIARKVVNML